MAEGVPVLWPRRGDKGCCGMFIDPEVVAGAEVGVSWFGIEDEFWAMSPCIIVDSWLDVEIGGRDCVRCCVISCKEPEFWIGSLAM